MTLKENVGTWVTEEQLRVFFLIVNSDYRMK